MSLNQQSNYTMEKDFLELSGSLSVKTDILRDMIIVSLQGV